jgi:hypothetical protein
VPHQLDAVQQFKMLLTLFRTQAQTDNR